MELIAESEHGFQCCEPRLPCWYHQAGMQQLAIQLLDVMEIVGALISPLLNGLDVFLDLLWSCVH
jgi:hypothetical protein